MVKNRPFRARRLQVCAQNRVASRHDLIGLLERNGWRVETATCLDWCTRCNHCAFALVEGRFLFAENGEVLVERLRDWGRPEP
jgi:uncharacterized protein YuzB (UPF0349 family)